MKRLMAFMMLVLASCASTHASIVLAASCSEADITTALTTAVTGDTVLIPACNQTHTVQLNSNNPYTKGITIQGAGVGRTNITLGNIVGGAWLQLAPTTGASRVCCMSVGGPLYTAESAAITLNGSPTSMRVDHMDFANLGVRAIEWGAGNLDQRDGNLNVTCTPMVGLVDHINWIQSGAVPFMRSYGCSNVWGQGSLIGDVTNTIVLEDSVLTSTLVPWQSTSDIYDVECASRIIVRRNVINNTFQQTHDTGGTGECRGTRSLVYQDNIFNCTTAAQCNTAFDMRGGVGVAFNNFVQLARYSVNMTTTEVYRDGAGPYALPGDFQSGSSTHKVCTHRGHIRSMCDGTPHTPCGFSSTWSVGGTPCFAFEGAGNCQRACTFDTDCQNPQLPNEKCIAMDDGGTGGYPSRDQVSAGQDVGGTLVQSVIDPWYFFANFDSLNANAVITGGITVAAGDTTYVQVNRDFYQEVASFTGASGVGRGLLSARPATCTTGPAGAPGVGYFATDTNTLYRCTATNTWAAYYTPGGRHSLSDPIPARVSVAAL